MDIWHVILHSVFFFLLCFLYSRRICTSHRNFLLLAVSLSLRYGYYGNHHLVLGPNSSRLMKASSVFVEQIQVRGDANKGLLLYGFLEKPELSLETNWTTSNYLFVEAYGRQVITFEDLV